MEKPSPPLRLDLAATCACDGVEARVAGPVVSMFLCACLDCQKISGGGHSHAVLVPAAALTIRGKTQAFVRSAESGATFTRHFCPNCAATIFAQSSRAPELRIVATGLFAGQNGWFSPNQLIFARSHCAWDAIADDLPRYDTYRESEPV